MWVTSCFNGENGIPHAKDMWSGRAGGLETHSLASEAVAKVPDGSHGECSSPGGGSCGIGQLPEGALPFLT